MNPKIESMKRGRKILVGTLIGLVVIVLLCTGGSYSYLQSLQPTYEGKLKLEGLQEDVEVYFDEYGIPHLYGQSEEDLYHALGYLHAQERLFQMEMLRRVGSGRLAEILGEDLIQTDRFFRTIGIKEVSKMSAKAFMAERESPHQKAFSAYLDGLNTYIDQGNTPLEFQILGIEKEHFTVEDIYCIAGYMGYTFNVAYSTDPILTKIKNKLGDEYLKDFAIRYKEGTMIPSYPTEKAKEGAEQDRELISQAMGKIIDKLPVPIWSGSNSWVVSGKKTKSGKVYLANDAHIGYSQPAVWFEAHLEGPGLSFYGNFVAGMPFSTIGHTRTHAWGVTMLENDDTDLYQEKLNPDNPNQVKFKDSWEDLTIRKEVIKVKGKEDIEFEVKISRHGPIINDCIEGMDEITSDPISASMTLTQIANPVFEAFYIFSKAKNIQEFEAACAMMTAPGFNIMYGDTAGNIAWWAVGKLSRRADHINSKFILNGYDGNDELLGYYDFSENPKSINPPSNYVYSANNQPDTAFGQFHQGYYLPEFRAKRIVSLLEQENAFDTDKMKKMINDGVSAKYPEVAKEIVGVLENGNIDLSENQQKVLSILKSWEGHHNLDSKAPTIFYKLVYHILAEAMTDELGVEDFEATVNMLMMKRTLPLLVRNDGSLWWNDVDTDAPESRKDIFARAFEKTISELEAQLGNDPQTWEWQQAHTITHSHAFGQDGGALGAYFNVGPFPINGGHEVINNLSFNLNGEGKYEVKSGPSKRILIDFSDVENALSVSPTGQSGVAGSPHYDDQAALFTKGEFRKMKMNEKEIKEGGRHLLLKAK